MEDAKRPKVTVEELRAQLRSDPKGFATTLEQLLATCTDAESSLFWRAMKKFAENSSKG